uniref:Aminoglycoside phosphotransferase domain-containing protein n=1 Tax=Coccidioides posadasii RMSCC 3488 TaxID=454284 RepID=A0A0J6FPL3_COCPO|nr:hypothetical protein CPAG_07702 [Coccidioides posadasii RMSCC 3488]
MVQVPEMWEPDNKLWTTAARQSGIKIGEEAFPGNAEEKVHSKIATYIWISKNCPDIPIPKLQGFGVPSGLSAFSGYIPQHRPVLLRYPYILVDWIEHSDAQMRSNVFTMPHTEVQTRNLYRSISRIMISLAKFHSAELVPGRLITMDELAYPIVPYARGQAKDLVLMQALLHLFTDRHLHNSPFVMQLADMHAINIFVDEDWNIKHVVDLEWACCLPLGNLLSPFWLNGQSVDGLDGPEYEQFKACYEQFTTIFTTIFEQEETDTPLHHKGSFYSCAKVMKGALYDGRY